MGRQSYGAKEQKKEDRLKKLSEAWDGWQNKDKLRRDLPLLADILEWNHLQREAQNARQRHSHDERTIDQILEE